MKTKGNANLILALCVLAMAIISCNNQSNKSQADSSKTENKKDMETNNLIEFGKKYAQAWCTQIRWVENP